MKTSSSLPLLLTALLIAACGAAVGAPGGSPSPTPAPRTAPPSATPITAEEAVRRVLASDPRFAGRGPRRDDVIGQSSWYEVRTLGDGSFEVAVRMGWGDCPSGCISQHRWVHAVSRSGEVRLLREEGDPLPSAATGLRGTVAAGPTCPVVQDPPDEACKDRPVAGAVLVITDPAGMVVARVVTDANGRYSVELAPGSYTVTPQPVEGLMGTPAAQQVGIGVEDGMSTLDLGYDTGIR